VYVAFEDYGYEGKATVMTYTGSEWENVGPEGFSASEADFTSLAFSPSGQPYLAWEDYSCGGKATVMKYDSLYMAIEEPGRTQLSVSPNPAYDILTIDRGNIAGADCRIEIFDLTGREISEIRTPGKCITIDVSGYPSGSYFIRMNSGSKNYYARFFKD
jgi:hypothetical protein